MYFEIKQIYSHYKNNRKMFYNKIKIKGRRGTLSQSVTVNMTFVGSGHSPNIYIILSSSL